MLDDSSLGYIYHHFYLLGPHVSHNGIASILNHTYIRTRDSSLEASTSNEYLHFIFNIKLNSRLNNNSSKMLLKRELSI